jgi:hypothetical protein
MNWVTEPNPAQGPWSDGLAGVLRPRFRAL